MNPFALNLAYKFVATSLMLVQVNLFCEKVGLPLEHPVAHTDILAESHVGPANTNDFSGSIVTDQYAFGFGRGHLSNFVKKGFTPRTDLETKKRNEQLAKLSSLIDTNEAYELATNWLASAGVDLRALESKYRRNVFQWKSYPEMKTDGQLRPMEKISVPLPIFQVEWRGELILRGKKFRERPIVSITLSGVTKELIEYHNLDDSLMLNPPIKILEQTALLAVSDSEFQTFSPVQRTNLLRRFGLKLPNENATPGTPN